MRFVQVGDTAVNMDRVEVVTVSKDRECVTLQFPGISENQIIFLNKRAERFLAWWDNKAEVFVT